ncbi:MAG: hypothetical protein LLG05_14070, partial [Porphyromonadaceae bacterium]|nr:hypothetical protein [Porphyromonadaceae bacterium]
NEISNFGGITTEEAGNALREVLTKVQEDPYYQSVILPMMEARIRYDESWRGKLFPYSPVDRLKREILVWKIVFFFCVSVLIGLLILDLRLISIM